jgi:hypothetical protein
MIIAISNVTEELNNFLIEEGFKKYHKGQTKSQFAVDILDAYMKRAKRKLSRKTL